MVGLLARMMNAQVTTSRFCLLLRAPPKPFVHCSGCPDQSCIRSRLRVSSAMSSAPAALRNSAEGSKGSALKYFSCLWLFLAIFGVFGVCGVSGNIGKFGDFLRIRCA